MFNGIMFTAVVLHVRAAATCATTAFQVNQCVHKHVGIMIIAVLFARTCAILGKLTSLHLSPFSGVVCLILIYARTQIF